MKRLGVVVALLSGCSTSPAALSSGPTESLVRHFPDGLGAPALVETGVVDGRRLAVYCSRPASAGQFAQRSLKVCYQGRPVSDEPDAGGDPLDGFYELRDADSGVIRLPLDWHKIVLIPGLGVWVLPAELRAKGDRWGRYDVKGGYTGPSDVRRLVRRGASWFILRDAGADIVAPPGHVLGRYEEVDGDPRPAGSFHFLRSRGVDYLLGENLELLAAMPDPVRELGPFLGRRAPGTSEADDLWVLLQKDGSFAAPPGVLGLRPAPGGWLARFAKPGEPGYVEGTPAPLLPWGTANLELTEISRPKWMSADLVLPYEGKRPILVTSDGSRWTAELAGERGGEDGASEAEAVGKLLKRDAAAKERLRTAWRDALELKNAGALAALAWELGGDAWYDAALRTPSASAERLDWAASRVKGAGLSEELRRRARRRREELAAEDTLRRHQADRVTAARLRATEAYARASGLGLAVPPLRPRPVRASAWDPLR